MAQMTRAINDTEQLAAIMALRSFSPEAKTVLGRLAASNRPSKEIRREFLKILPSWERIGDQIEVVIEYMRSGGDE